MKKLDHKKVGPFPVTRRVETRTYQVKLPENMHIHNMFHVSILEPYQVSDIHGHHQVPPEPDEVEDEKFWKVEGVVKSRWQGRKKRVEYLVKWEGYPAEEATWEPWDHLEDDEDMVKLVKEFHRRYPSQKKDVRVG